MEDFDAWYAREHPRVLTACAALAGDVDLAGDATDEAFMRALERWAKVSEMLAPGGWVQTVALNHLRRVMRRRRLESTRGPGGTAVVLPDPELWMVVRALPARQQTVIVLTYVHDLPGAAIADIMGIAPGTVSSTLDAARRSLRRQLVDPVTPRGECPMVDLKEAGERLSLHRVGPTPPAADLRQRSTGRVRRRRRRRSGAMALAAVVSVVVAVVGGVRLERSPHDEAVTVIPREVTPLGVRPGNAVVRLRDPGARPVDWGQLRLWLPSSWTITAGPGLSADRGCWTPPTRSVYYASEPEAICRGAQDETWVEVAALTHPPPSGWTHSIIDAMPVRSSVGDGGLDVDVPSLDVAISGHGRSSGVVASLGPSALHAVVSDPASVIVPRHWRTVSFNGFEADVPAGWPTSRARSIHTRNGVSYRGDVPSCGLPFDRVALFIGVYDSPPTCSRISEQAALARSTKPMNGLWLETSAAGYHLPSVADGYKLRHIAEGSTEVTLAYLDQGGSNMLDLAASADGSTLQAVVGLGADPTVAEQIISSIRPVGAPSGHDPASPNRTVDGTLRVYANPCTGPVGPKPTSAKVRVEIRGSQALVRTIVVPYPQSYSVRLAPGTYRAGEVDTGPLRSVVTIRRASTSSVELEPDCG